MAGINFRNNFPKCHHYYRGYCRHRDQCWYQHFGNICHEKSCVRENCLASICAFTHENDKNPEEENNIKIHELEIQLKNFKRINKKLQEENYALKSKSSSIEPKELKELESLKIETINLKKENGELREEMHKVEHDAEVMKAKLLDEKKENVYKNNLLQESNEKVDKVKEDLVKEVESHKVSRKAIDELLVKTQEADQRLKKY